MQNVFNFSGGKTSARMTIEYYQPGDIVLFTDTGREHPKTYKFLNDFEAYEGIPVIRAQYPGGWDGFLKEKGYNFLPNRVMRKCTKYLKIVTARNYLLSIGVKECNNFIGFRADEKPRVDKFVSRYKRYIPRFPLYDAGITKAHVNEFWLNKPYTLEIPHILGNCDLCFLKGKNKIISILTHYPNLADKWINDEKQFGSSYIKGITYEQMKQIAQNNLFKEYPLDDLTPEYSCACTNY